MPQILEITPANEIKQIIIEDIEINDQTKFIHEFECNMYNTYGDGYLIIWNDKTNGPINKIANPMIQTYGTIIIGKPLTNYDAYGSVYVIKQLDGKIMDSNIDEFVHNYNNRSPHEHKIEHVLGNIFRVVRYPMYSSSENSCTII